MQIEESSVIWVGPSEGKVYGFLLAAIRKRGMGIATCATLDNWANTLKGHKHPVIVACD